MNANHRSHFELCMAVLEVCRKLKWVQIDLSRNPWIDSFDKSENLSASADI